MIVAVLILYNYGASFLKYVGFNKFFGKNDWAVLIFDVPTVDGESIYSKSNHLKFSPPLYIQRYTVVKKILKIKSNECILKVIDFGCSDISFFKNIKHMKGVREYIAVDIDENLLNRCSCKTLPLTYDYLKKRTEPLTVQVLCGSVSQPDHRLQNSNAVIAIELIEHLYPDVLEELPYNIFGLIQPDIAVFTTPNSEYNIFFHNFSGFRHDDHKFEWSREQFQSWANNLVVRYPNYKVVFGGVGKGPDPHQDFGYCTQIAVFFRNNTKVDTSSQFSDLYKAIRTVDYPFSTEAERLEDIIKFETEKFIFYNSNLDCYNSNGRIEIPLKDIHNFLPKEYACTEENLRDVLTACGRDIETLKNGISVLILSAYGEEDLDDSYISSSPSSVEDHGQLYSSVLLPTEEEDWDVITSIEMNLGQDGIEKATNTDGEPSRGAIDEPLAHTDRSALESSHQNNCNANSVRSLLQLEEARSSSPSSGPSESNCYSKSKCNSSPLEAVKNENSHEKNASSVRTPLQKCHSLENINRDRSRSNPFRFSLNIDKYKFIDCDIDRSGNNGIQTVTSALSVSDTFVPRQEDSCSQSKAADSGYPNSYGQDMDMDLTPEQVDEIITESESSFDGDVEDESGGEEDEPIEIRGEVVRLGENVENGDVANNNRDGEGNNMEAVAAGGVLQFEQVIAEEEVVIGNFAAAIIPDSDEDLGSLLSLGERGLVPASEGEFEEVLPNQPEVSSFFVPVSNIVFPEWLLSILVDDVDNEADDDGAGDAGVLRQQGGMVRDEGSNDDVQSVISEIEQFSDLELLQEPPVELIVQGDLMGGGEPPPSE